MAKIGDTVRFLNSIGGGRIVAIDGNIARVEDEDGFEVPMLLKECVVVLEASKQPASRPGNAAPAAPSPAAAPATRNVAPAEPEPPLPVVETAEGNKLNVTLAFESLDIKRLTASNIEATLVNDSNYYLSFVFATCGDDDEEWSARRVDTVEPNMMLSLGEFGRQELNSLQRILFQCVAFKSGKGFAMKAPVNVDLRVDATKFCKLHCFRDNPYFDEPVIAYALVTDDKPYTPVKVTADNLEEAMRQKRAADRRPARPVKRREQRKNDVIEVDLHIDQLLDTTAGLSRADMLNAQVDEFRRVMDANLKKHGQRIVFIHGKGEGILRQALLKELNHRYKGHDVSDASFREYGFGATQVIIR